MLKSLSNPSYNLRLGLKWHDEGDIGTTMKGRKENKDRRAQGATRSYTKEGIYSAQKFFLATTRINLICFFPADEIEEGDMFGTVAVVGLSLIFVRSQ